MIYLKKEVRFPVFRKYPHERTFFKITSFDTFEELQIIGNKYIIHQITATILPERNYIRDMLFDFSPYWLKIEEEEYELKKKQYMNNKL